MGLIGTALVNGAGLLGTALINGAGPLGTTLLDRIGLLGTAPLDSAGLWGTALELESQLKLSEVLLPDAVLPHVVDAGMRRGGEGTAQMLVCTEF